MQQTRYASVHILQKMHLINLLEICLLLRKVVLTPPQQDALGMGLTATRYSCKHSC